MDIGNRKIPFSGLSRDDTREEARTPASNRGSSPAPGGPLPKEGLPKVENLFSADSKSTSSEIRAASKPAKASPTISQGGALAIPGKGSSISAKNAGIQTGFLRAGTEELKKAREERNALKAEKKQQAKSRPLSAEQSLAAHRDAVLAEEAHKDLADRSLARLPNADRAQIADGKIYAYALNSSSRDGSSKAAAFASLGYEMSPAKEGQMPKNMPNESGESLKSQIKSEVKEQHAVLEPASEFFMANRGIPFAVTAQIKGREDQAGSSRPFKTTWLDKRQSDGTTNGVPELTTIFPDGKKEQEK